MVLRVVAALVLVLGVARMGSAQEPTVQLVHDEAEKEFVVVIGPVDLPAGAMPMEEAGEGAVAEMGGHGGHGGHGGAVFLPVTEVSFPFAVYLYGFDYEVLDGEGARLPTELVHHLNLINPDSRELFLPISQRMLAVGKETGAQSMPRLLMGYPVPGGTRMVVSTMLHNPTGETHSGVRVRVRLKYVKAGRPWPLMNVYPFQMDVAFPAGDKAFDLPPGESTWSYEASPVMPGRIMVIGSHLHENATSIKFEDVTENRVIWEGRAITDEGDEVVGVTIGHLYRTGGVKITPDHVYRVSVTYDNPSADTLYDGGMGVVAGAFKPANAQMWPRAPLQNELYLLDRAHYLQQVRGRYEMIAGMSGDSTAGAAAAEHDHSTHQH